MYNKMSYAYIMVCLLYISYQLCSVPHVGSLALVGVFTP